MSIVKILSWCLFDFATTIFMMNIVSLSFVQWLEKDFGNGDIYYGIISMIVYGLCLFLYPLTGFVCDRGWKVLPLFLLTSVSIIGVWSLGFCHHLIGAGLLFILAYLPYQMALTFYNALLDDIATPKYIGIISGMGIASRYIGAICGLFSINFFIRHNFQITLPSYLGGYILQLPEFLNFLLLQPVPEGQVLYKNAFLPTAFLYATLTLPLFIFISMSRNKSDTTEKKKSLSLQEILHNLKKATRNKNTFFLLVTILLTGIPLYASVHFMSVFLEKVAQFPPEKTPLFLIFATVFSVVGGLGFGLLIRPLGSKKTFTIIIAIWAVTLLVGSVSYHRTIFWILGAFSGLGMGGYWATSRVLVLDVTPPGQKGIYLALYWIVIVGCGIIGSGIWPLCVYIANFIGFPETPQRLSTFVLGLVGFMGLFTFSRVAFQKN